MAAVGDEKKRLMQTGVFRTQNDVVTYLLARMIGKSETPVGAWTLKEELEQSGACAVVRDAGELEQLLLAM